MIRLNDLIHVYDDTLEPYVCNFLIDFFDKSESLHQPYLNDGCAKFTQINLTENYKSNEELIQIHTYIVKKIFEYKSKYYNYIDSRVFPDKHALEQIKIKKYNNDGEDMFKTHVNVTDHEKSRRFLSYLWYLNDVETGGETKFQDLTVKPKTGRLIMFPPMWMFPHSGEPPISGVKYIMSAYLHYK